MSLLSLCHDQKLLTPKAFLHLSVPKLLNFKQGNPSVTLFFLIPIILLLCPVGSFMPKPCRFYRHTLPKPLKHLTLPSSPSSLNVPFQFEKCFSPVSASSLFLSATYLPMSLDGSSGILHISPHPPPSSQCNTSQIELCI